MANIPWAGEGGFPILELPAVLAVGTLDLGPFTLTPFSGIFLDMTRSADGAGHTSTCAVTLLVDDPVLGKIAQLDGAGATVEINDWAAAENVRRTLQVHPFAGPMPFDDADGVFKVGTTGVASNYYRQPVLEPFWLRVVVGTEASTFSGATLYLLR